MIILTRVVHRMIQHVVNHEKVGSNEVALFGKVEVLNGTIYITDVFVPEQEVGGAHTHMEADEVVKMYTGLVEQGENISLWRCWIHKHPGTGTSPTPGTDDETLEALARQFSSSEELDKHFAVGIIASGDGKYGGYLHLCSPFDLPIGDVKVYIESEPLPEETVTRLDLMLEGVRKKTFSQGPKGGRNTWSPPTKNGQRSLASGTGGTNKNSCILLSEKQGKDSMSLRAWSSKWGSEFGQTIWSMDIDALQDLCKVWGFEEVQQFLGKDEDYKLVIRQGVLIGLCGVEEEQAHNLSLKAIHEKHHEDGQWPDNCTYCKKDVQEEQGKEVKVVGKSIRTDRKRKGGKR